MKGYVKEVDLQQGLLGTAIKQSSTTYIQHSAGTATATPVTVTVVASQTVYSGSDGDGARETDYNYVWYGDLASPTSTVSVQPYVVTMGCHQYPLRRMAQAVPTSPAASSTSTAE